MMKWISVFRAGIFFALILGAATSNPLAAQAVTPLLTRVQVKLNTVKNYRAQGRLHTDVSFIKIPESDVTVLFKNPDKFRIKKKEGISIVPKGGVSINLNALISGKEYTAVDAGKSTWGGKQLAVVKLLPLQENSDIVLSTLYIDEANAVVRRAQTTTRNNGSYEMELVYGKYLSWGLPDKVIFTFNTKDYKLPKGVTFEYETGQKPPAGSKTSNEGRIEIAYSSYIINKGIPDSEFQ